MTDPTEPGPDPVLEETRARAEAAERALETLQATTEAAERALETLQATTEARLIHAELKAEAVRAGIVDLDGLKLLDLSTAKLNVDGKVENAATLLAGLKREKPWLFAGHSSSSAASPPPAASPSAKKAADMSDAEYRAARAALIKRR